MAKQRRLPDDVPPVLLLGHLVSARHGCSRVSVRVVRLAAVFVLLLTASQLAFQLAVRREVICRVYACVGLIRATLLVPRCQTYSPSLFGCDRYPVAPAYWPMSADQVFAPMPFPFISHGIAQLTGAVYIPSKSRRLCFHTSPVHPTCLQAEGALPLVFSPDARGWTSEERGVLGGPAEEPHWARIRTGEGKCSCCRGRQERAGALEPSRCERRGRLHGRDAWDQLTSSPGTWTSTTWGRLPPI